MKRLKYWILAAALLVASATTVTGGSAEAAADGQWLYGATGITYRFADGSFAKNEYVSGYWLEETGYWDGRRAKARWAHDENGWWYRDGRWYPRSSWLRIDGDWYYFDEQGYMASNEYIGSKYVDESGRLDPERENGTWVKKRGSKTFRDGEWSPVDRWLRIDGEDYYFDEHGEVKTNELMVVIPQDQIYCFDEDGHQTTYTRVRFREDMKVMNINLHCDEPKVDILAKDLERYLYDTSDEDTELILQINGLNRKLSFKNDMLYIDETAFSDFMTTLGTGDIRIVVGDSPRRVLSGSLSGRADFYSYRSGVEIEIGDDAHGTCRITNLLINSSLVYFTVETKGENGAVVEEGFVAKGDANRYLYFEGDITDSEFLKLLVKAGIVEADCAVNQTKK